MRDLADKWTPVPDWTAATLSMPGLSGRSMPGLSQLLVSGDAEAWAKISGLAAEPVGALATAMGGRYALRIARDRILAVSETPFDTKPGWHAGCFAVSACDAGLHVFEIEGERLGPLWAQATTLDPAAETASAAIQFAGIPVFCCRHGHERQLRIHVDRTLAAYLWAWLQRVSIV